MQHAPLNIVTVLLLIACSALGCSDDTSSPSTNEEQEEQTECTQINEALRACGITESLNSDVCASTAEACVTCVSTAACEELGPDGEACADECGATEYANTVCEEPAGTDALEHLFGDWFCGTPWEGDIFIGLDYTGDIHTLELIKATGESHFLQEVFNRTPESLVRGSAPACGTAEPVSVNSVVGYFGLEDDVVISTGDTLVIHDEASVCGSEATYTFEAHVLSNTDWEGSARACTVEDGTNRCEIGELYYRGTGPL